MTKQENKIIVRNFLSLSVVQGINALLQLLVVPFVILKIGIENFGIIAVAQVLLFFLSTVAEYGFQQTGSRWVSLHRENKDKLSALFFQSIYLKIILSAAGFLLLYIVSFLLPFVKENLLLYALAFVFVPGQALLPTWFFQGFEKLHASAICLLISKIIFVLLVFLIIRNPGHAVLFLFFLGLGNLITAIAASVYIIKKYQLKPQAFSVNEFSALIKEGAPVVAGNLTMNLMQYGNLFILRLYSNDVVAGYFSVAERIYFAMKQVVSAFSQTIYPAVCRLKAEEYKGYFKKTFVPFFSLVLLACAITAIAAPAIIHFFVSTPNKESVWALRIFCCIVPIVCLNIPGTLTLLAQQERKKYFQIFAAGLVINMVFNFLLVPAYFSTGTLIAVSVTELFITAMVSLVLYRITKLSS